jgi:chorismate mutase
MLLVSDTGFPNSEFSLSELMEGMFDQVSERTQIEPGETMPFSFDATSDVNSLFWGLQIMDYQNADSVSVTISNIYGDDLGTFSSKQPAFFETMQITNADIYNFNVKNTGQRPISVMMMFTKNPEESEKFSDPNSPLAKTILPLAISGILLILGIIIIIIGVIILVIDYKKKQDSKYT